MDRADAPDAGPARRHPRARRSWSGFALLSVAVAALFLIPVASILFSLTQSGSGTWTHLASTVLPMYLFHTAVLVAGVGIGVPVICSGTAWLVPLCRFPARRFFEWALILPLAFPGSVIAFPYAPKR